MIRILRLSACALLLIGSGLILASWTFPLYTDASAPSRLSAHLHHGQIQEWYYQLATYETPRKALFNWGQGLFTLGAALLVGLWIGRLYLTHPRLQNMEGFFIGWTVLWLLRFPATVYYYWLRQGWFEYPTWSDSISVPILREFTAWISGAVITTIFLIALIIGRQMPNRLQWSRPSGILESSRLGILLLWQAALAYFVIGSLPNGDVGMIFSGTLAAVLLTLLIAAPAKIKTPETTSPI